MFCLSSFKQLNFYDQVSEIQNLSHQKPVRFLKLIKENFDINSFIPKSFFDSYYSNLGSNRNFSLPSILSALTIMHIFKIQLQAFSAFFQIFLLTSESSVALIVTLPMKLFSVDLKPLLNNKLLIFLILLPWMSTKSVTKLMMIYLKMIPKKVLDQCLFMTPPV